MPSIKPLWTKPSLSRDFALLAGVIVFILIVVSLWVAYETFEAHSEKVIKELESEATRVDRAMIIEIEHASYLVESLGRQIAEYEPQEKLDRIARIFKSFDVEAITYNVFSWINPDQMLVVSSNRGVLAKPIDVSDRDYMKMTIAEPWKIQIGRPVQGRVSEKWILPVAIGITDKNDEYIGTLLLSMDISELTRELENVIRKSGISFAIFSKTMVLLTEHDATHQISSSTRYIDQLKKIDFTRNPAGALSLGSFYKRDRLFTYYEVSANYPYIIVLGYDSQVSEQTVRGLLLPRLLQLALMAVFALSILWMVRGRIIKPILELKDIAAGVAQGKRFTTPLMASPIEVESLSDELQKLGNYITEQRRMVEEKEHKNLLLKKTKESAELSNRIKVEFLSAMSHELRTPLNTIVGFAEIMNNEMHGALGNPQYAQYVTDIYASGRNLQELIDDVLALSSAEAGLLELQEKPVDVRFIINKCVRVLAEKLQQMQIQVEVKIQEHLPRLMVDELRLKQIIINLLSNAAKHTPPGGYLMIDAHIEKDKKMNDVFAVSFTDSGSKATGGAHIPLEGLSERSWRHGDITSLSIPLTKALVAMHQATLDIISPPGKATTVTVRFPKDRIVY